MKSSFFVYLTTATDQYLYLCFIPKQTSTQKIRNLIQIRVIHLNCCPCKTEQQITDRRNVSTELT